MSQPQPQPSRSWGAALIVLLALAACTSAAQEPPASPTSGPTATSPTNVGPIKLTPMETFATDFPQDLVIAFDSVWTANEFVDTVTRIDPGTGDVTEISVDPGLGPQSLEAAGGAIWTRGGGGINRIDPETNAVTAYIDSGGNGGLVFAFGSLWSTHETAVDRIDPQTGTIVDTFEASKDDGRATDAGCGVTAAVGSIWLSCDETLDRLDPATGDVIATIRHPGHVVAAGGAVWLMETTNPFQVSSAELNFATLDRIDPETNQVVPGTTVEIVRGNNVNAPLVDGHLIWLPTSFGDDPGAGMLHAFDARSGELVAAFDLSEGKGYGSNTIGFGYGSMWTASGPANQVRRFPIPPG